MHFEAERVRHNAQQATTEDLLDRITVYRAGMEPDAVDIIETELSRRGVGAREIDEHLSRRGAGLLVDANGLTRECSLCRRPAVLQRWGWDWVRFPFWHWRLPLFPRPRVFSYCEQHRPSNVTET